MTEQLTLDAPLRDLHAPAIGRERAKAGMAATLEAEREAWLAAAMAALRRYVALPEVRRFKLEDFRAWYSAQRLPQPHTHKVWGGFTDRACKQGVIRWTETFARSVSPKTHGHWVKVWEAA